MSKKASTLSVNHSDHFLSRRKFQVNADFLLKTGIGATIKKEVEGKSIDIEVEKRKIAVKRSRKGRSYSKGRYGKIFFFKIWGLEQTL